MKKQKLKTKRCELGWNKGAMVSELVLAESSTVKPHV